MKKILIVSTDKFPNGNAGAVRQETLAKLFKECGYNSNIIALGDSTRYEMKRYNGIIYCSFRSEKIDIYHKFLNYATYKSRLKKFITANKEKFDAILVVNVPIDVFLFLKKYSKKNNIRLLHDCVEWYSASQFKFGIFSPNYIKKDFINKILIDKNVSVISISKYLNNYFSNKNISTVRIPFILDVKNIRFKKNLNKDKVVFTYAGAMGKKDNLKEFIKATAMLSNEEKEKIEIRIFGVSKNELIKTGGVDIQTLELLKKQIKIFGRVNRSIVIKNFEETDFTILLRNSEERYAKAGFPTKFVESLSYGTPVFCNLSSDLGDYINDGEECIVIKDLSQQSMINGIKQAIMLSEEDRKNMQIKARLCAEKNFDYRIYNDKIMQIFK